MLKYTQFFTDIFFNLFTDNVLSESPKQIPSNKAVSNLSR